VINSAVLSIDSALEVWASARCAQVDPELSFPANGHADSSRAAKTVCGRCPVREPCLETFDLMMPHGVIGGLTSRERRNRRRSLRREGRAA
jgi:WhiB family redox-sensing transcriptional regulator